MEYKMKYEKPILVGLNDKIGRAEGLCKVGDFDVENCLTGDWFGSLIPCAAGSNPPGACTPGANDQCDKGAEI
jgi:hypothetical protein